MIKDKYLEFITQKINQLTLGKDSEWFIFGSSLNKGHFGDIDLGFMGKINKNELTVLKEEFEESTFPYFIDIIDFNKASKEFRENVFDQNILWLKH
ncbi:hypothetical protein KKB83_04920 [Patescibacteria group bacterium]|nr:hypothetical protein [Patescibacteria group bacterium]